MAQPQRKKRHDRILSGMAHPDEIRCDMVTGPFDEATRRMDRKWGIDRLPDLVSVATAEKWGGALAKLNAAIQSGDVAETRSRVEVCLRGLTTMDAEATAAGQPTADPTVWECEHDGHRFGIIADITMWQSASDKRPDLQIVGIKEVAVAIHALRNSLPAIDEMRKAFPGATITAIRPKQDMEDEIPY